MKLKAVLSLFILMTIYVELTEATPTLGDEFVHIKVHVPEDVVNTHGVLKSTYPGSPQHPFTSHKVVHHYHRRRRPFKKSPPPAKAPALESIILEELDNRHKKEETDYDENTNEDTYLVEEVPVKKKKKVNAFKVIEETIQKPWNKYHSEEEQEEQETYKIIEDTANKKHAYKQVNLELHEEDFTPWKEYKKDKPHKEIIEIIEKPPWKEYNKETPHKETIEIIEKPHTKYPDNYYGHHSGGHHHYVTHESEEPAHHHYSSPHVESFEIIESKKSFNHPESTATKLYANYEHNKETSRPKVYDQETIEVTKTKSHPIYQHPIAYMELGHRHEQKSPYKQIIAMQKETVYKRPREEYVYHREIAEPVYSHVIKEPQVVIEKNLEYERPLKIYSHPNEQYEYGSQPAISYREYERIKNPSNTMQEDHIVYGTLPTDTSIHQTESLSPGYYYDSSVRPTTEKSYHYLSAPNAHREEIKYVTQPPTSYSTSYENLKYKTPSVILPDDSYGMQNYPKYVTAAPSYNYQDNSNEKYLPAPRLPANIDWPEGVPKTRTTESYSGIDSYSAGHVQGIDSGGYHYPPQ